MRLLQTIGGQAQRVLQNLRYRYLLALWQTSIRGRYLGWYLNRHSGLSRRVGLVAAGVAAGLLVNRFGAAPLSSATLSGYLVSIAAMIGGTIAIIFSISIFLLQGVADLYSSKHFAEYANNWRDQLIYVVVIALTLLLFGLGLYVGGIPTLSGRLSSGITLLSLTVIGVVFALIDWQYELVRQKITPANAIGFLNRKGFRFLRNLQRDAERIAAILMARDSTLTNEMALAAAYNHALQPFIRDLDRQLETLVEISLKLADREEVETTKLGFKSVHDLLAKFFEARRTSSLAVPSSAVFLAVESDSQRFLTANCERLNAAGDKFIKEGKGELATYIVDVYSGLARAAKDIEHLARGNDNPVLDLIVGYLDFYIRNAEAAKNTEVVFQGSRVLGDIAVMAADKGLGNTLYALQEKIMKAAVFGLAQKQNVIVDQCSVTFLKLISAVFRSNDLDRNLHFDKSLRNIASIAGYINTLIKAGVVPNDIAWGFSGSKGYDEFYSTLDYVVNHYAELTEEREKESYRGDLVEFFRELNLSLRKLSEEIKTADTTLVGSIGRLLYVLNTVIIDLVGMDDFAEEQDDLRKRLEWNVHLPGWFAYHAEGFDAGSNPFNTLTDSVAKTGILASEKLIDQELLIDCIGSLASFADKALEKTAGRYGFDEPRVMEKACYLGIIALKKGWTDAVGKIKIAIQNFEPKYFAKYLTNLPAGLPAGCDPRNHNIMGLPHHDQLLRELLRWRGEFDRESMSGMMRIRDDAEDMMYDVVDRDDIDRFMMEIWGVALAE